MTNSIDITASPANSVDRRGVNKKWVSSWKASLKNRQEWLATYDPHTRELLDFYVATGKTKQHNTDPLQPGEVAWEGYLGSDLNLYALLRAYECEKAAIVEKSFNVEFARRGFAASYLSQCIALGQQKKSMALRGWQLRVKVWMCFFLRHLVSLSAVPTRHFDWRKCKSSHTEMTGLERKINSPFSILFCASWPTTWANRRSFLPGRQ
jgi:hypothetical protein